MAKRLIRTKNREVYHKLNMLHVSDEVILRGLNPRYIDQVISKINNGGKVIEAERIGGSVKLRKVNRFDFDIYLD